MPNTIDSMVLARQREEEERRRREELERQRQEQEAQRQAAAQQQQAEETQQQPEPTAQEPTRPRAVQTQDIPGASQNGNSQLPQTQTWNPSALPDTGLVKIGRRPADRQLIGDLSQQGVTIRRTQDNPHSIDVDLRTVTTPEQAYAIAYTLRDDETRDQFLSDWKKASGSTLTLAQLRKAADASREGGVYASTRNEYAAKQAENKATRDAAMQFIGSAGLIDFNGQSVNVNTATSSQIIRAIRATADPDTRKALAEQFVSLTKTEGSRFYGLSVDKSELQTFIESADLSQSDYNAEVKYYQSLFYASSGHETENLQAYYDTLSEIEDSDQSDYVKQSYRQALQKQWTLATGLPAPSRETIDAAVSAVTAAPDAPTDEKEIREGVWARIKASAARLFDPHRDDALLEQLGIVQNRETEADEATPSEATPAETKPEEEPESEQTAEAPESAPEGDVPKWVTDENGNPVANPDYLQQQRENATTGQKMWQGLQDIWNGKDWRPEEPQTVGFDPTQVRQVADASGNPVQLAASTVSDAPSGIDTWPTDPDESAAHIYADFVRKGQANQLDENRQAEFEAYVNSSPGLAELYGPLSSSEKMLLSSVLGTDLHNAAYQINSNDFPADERARAFSELAKIIKAAEKADQNGELDTSAYGDIVQGAAYKEYLKQHPEAQAILTGIQGLYDESIAAKQERQRYLDSGEALKDAQAAVLSGEYTPEQMQLVEANKPALNVVGIVDDEAGKRLLDTNNAQIKMLGMDAFYTNAVRDYLTQLHPDQPIDLKSPEAAKYTSVLSSYVKQAIAEDIQTAKALGFDDLNAYFKAVGVRDIGYYKQAGLEAMEQVNQSVSPEDLLAAGEVASHYQGTGQASNWAVLGAGLGHGTAGFLGEGAEAIYNLAISSGVDWNPVQVRADYTEQPNGLFWGATNYREDLLRMCDEGQFPSEELTAYVKNYLSDLDNDPFALGIIPDSMQFVRDFAVKMDRTQEMIETYAQEDFTPNQGFWFEMGSDITSNIEMQAVSTILTIGLSGAGVPGMLASAAGMYAGYGPAEYNQGFRANVEEYGLKGASAIGLADATGVVIANMPTNLSISRMVHGLFGGLAPAAEIGLSKVGTPGVSKILLASKAFAKGLFKREFDEVVHDEFYERQNKIALESLVKGALDADRTGVEKTPAFWAKNVLNAAGNYIKGIPGTVDQVIEGAPDVAVHTLFFAVLGGAGNAVSTMRTPVELFEKAAKTGDPTDLQSAMDAMDEAFKDPETQKWFNDYIKSVNIANETARQLVTAEEGPVAEFRQQASAAIQQEKAHRAEMDASQARMAEAARIMTETQDAIEQGDISPETAQAHADAAMDYAKAQQGFTEHEREANEQHEAGKAAFQKAYIEARKIATQGIHVQIATEPERANARVEDGIAAINRQVEDAYNRLAAHLENGGDPELAQQFGERIATALDNRAQYADVLKGVASSIQDRIESLAKEGGSEDEIARAQDQLNRVTAWAGKLGEPAESFIARVAQDRQQAAENAPDIEYALNRRGKIGTRSDADYARLQRLTESRGNETTQEEAPAVEEAAPPAEESAPTEETTHESEESPAAEETPAAEEQPAAEQQPAEQPKPVFNRPLSQKEQLRQQREQQKIDKQRKDQAKWDKKAQKTAEKQEKQAERVEQEEGHAQQERMRVDPAEAESAQREIADIWRQRFGFASVEEAREQTEQRKAQEARQAQEQAEWDEIEQAEAKRQAALTTPYSEQLTDAEQRAAMVKLRSKELSITGKQAKTLMQLTGLDSIEAINQRYGTKLTWDASAQPLTKVNLASITGNDAFLNDVTRTAEQMLVNTGERARQWIADNILNSPALRSARDALRQSRTQAPLTDEEAEIPSRAPQTLTDQAEDDLVDAAEHGTPEEIKTQIDRVDRLSPVDDGEQLEQKSDTTPPVSGENGTQNPIVVQETAPNPEISTESTPVVDNPAPVLETDRTGSRLRQFGNKTAQEADYISDTVKEELKGSSYDPVTLDSRIKTAQKRLDEAGLYNTADELYSKMDAGWTADDVVLAKAAIAKAKLDGDRITEARLAHMMDMQGTIQGQAFQARQNQALSEDDLIGSMITRANEYNHKRGIYGEAALGKATQQESQPANTNAALTNPAIQKLAGELHRKTGLTLVVTPLDEGISGYFDRQNGRIVVNSRLGAGNALREISLHELTHFLESSPDYARFAKAVLDAAYNGDTEAMERDRADIESQYTDAGVEHNTDNELVAEAVRKVLGSDEGFMRELFGDKPGFFARLYSKLRRFLASRLNAGTRAQYKALTRAESIMRRVMRTAGQWTQDTAQADTGSEYALAYQRKEQKIVAEANRTYDRVSAISSEDVSTNNRWGLPVTARQQALIDQYHLRGQRLRGQDYSIATTKERMLAAILATPDTPEHLATLTDKLARMADGQAIVTEADLNYIASQMADVIAAEGEDAPDRPVTRAGRIAYARALDAANNIIPKTNAEKARSYAYTNMLSGTPTQVRNVISNVAFDPLERVSTLLGSGIDKMLAKQTGTRTTGILTSAERRAGMQAFFDELAYAIDDYANHVDTSHSNRFDLGSGNGRTFQNSLFEARRRAVNFAMQVGDRPFYERVYANEKAVVERLDMKVKDADTGEMRAMTEEEIAKEAERRAKERIYQNQTGIGKALAALDEGNPIIAFVFRTLVPFTGTPTNIAARIWDYSPAGLATSLFSGFVRYQSGSTKFNQRDFVMKVGRGLTGTGLMLVGGLLAQAGFIRLGRGDEDDKNIRDFEKQLDEPYSMYLDLNGTKFDLSWALPVSAPLTAGAKVWHVMQQDYETNWDAAKAFGKAVILAGPDQVFENSMLKDAVNLLRGYNGVEGVATNIVGQVGESLMGMITPSSLRRLAQFSDPYVRDTSDENPLLDALKRSVIQYIPGLRQTLPTAIDVTGQPQRQAGIHHWGADDENAILDFLDMCISPTTPVGPRNDAALDELFKLALNAESASFLPKAFVDGDTLTVNKTTAQNTHTGREAYTLDISGDERRTLNQMYGQLLFDGQAVGLNDRPLRITGLRALMQSPRFQRMDDEDKIKAIKDAQTEAKEAVIADFYKHRRKQQ